MGLALWLVPREQQVLKQEMEMLQKTNAGNTSAPFPPHVTLVAGLQTGQNEQDADTTWSAFLGGLAEWRKKTNHSEGTSPLKCPFEAVTTRGIYFQCIELALQKIPALLSLNTQMRETFSLQDQPEYFPHCSLLYAPLSLEEATMQIDEMQGRGIFRPSSSKKAISFGRNTASAIAGITLDRIELWDCNGPVYEWKNLKGISLCKAQ